MPLIWTNEDACANCDEELSVCRCLCTHGDYWTECRRCSDTADAFWRHVDQAWSDFKDTEENG